MEVIACEVIENAFLSLRCCLRPSQCKKTASIGLLTIQYVADRIRFGLCVQVYNYKYQHSQTSSPGIRVPRHNLSTYGRLAFAVAGPDAWNSLSDDLRDPALSTDSFRRLLNCLRLVCFQSTTAYNALGVLYCAIYLLTYLLTYSMGPGYLVELCGPVSNIVGHQHL